MSEKLNRQDEAIRLFGALSGVDEKYLAACENQKKQGGVVLFMHKYGKAVAAVLCLAVLGAGYVTLQTGVKYNAGETAMAPQSVTMSDGAWKDAMDMEAAASEAPAMDTAEESVLEDMENSMETESSAASGNTAVNGLPEPGMEKGENNQDSVNPEQSVQSSDMVELTLDEARDQKVIGQYIPIDWPADGDVTQVIGRSVEGEESVTICWMYENNWDSFLITIDNLGEELPEWVLEQMSENYIVNKEDFTEEYVESQMKTPVGDSGDTDTPRGRFGVLYEDVSGYVLVQFNGRGNADEIWKMMN